MSARGPKPQTARNRRPAAPVATPLGVIEPTSTLDVDALKHFYKLLADLDRMGILERVDITLVTEAARIKECLDRVYEMNNPIKHAGKIAQFTCRYQGLVRMLGLSVQPSRSVVKTVAKDQTSTDPTASKIKLHA